MAETDAERLKELLYQAVAMTSPVRVDRIRPEHRLGNDLAFNSLRMLQLGLALDDLFGVQTVMLDETPATTTVGEILSYVEKMVQEGRATCPGVLEAETILRDLPYAERT